MQIYAFLKQNEIFTVFLTSIASILVNFASHMDFTTLITEWYNLNKRALPWRETRDPYLIWVSEVILQQTRVSQGLEYYMRFVKTFPDVNSLAQADEQDVLSIWKGLGYYSRARNMQAAAKMVMKSMNGTFPSDYNQLIKLKGIGKYTAAAISSICSGEKQAVVDGNVIRVFSRIFGYKEPADSTQLYNKIRLKSTALMELQNIDSGIYNQAVMEFGALWCKPKNPLCDLCIFKDDCFAFKNSMTEMLPTPRADVKRRKRWLNYLVVIQNESFLMQKRSTGDIWAGLWDFPCIEAVKLFSVDKMIVESEIRFGVSITQKPIVYEKDFRHLLTHREIQARFFILKLSDNKLIPAYEPAKFIPFNSLNALPVSRLVDGFIQKSGLIQVH